MNRGTGRAREQDVQDRLVKELRLAGAATLAEGHALLPAFMADYNARFATAPANNKDLHRPVRADDDLDNAYAWKEERTLSRALTLQYDNLWTPPADAANDTSNTSPPLTTSNALLGADPPFGPLGNHFGGSAFDLRAVECLLLGEPAGAQQRLNDLVQLTIHPQDRPAAAKTFTISGLLGRVSGHSLPKSKKFR